MYLNDEVFTILAHIYGFYGLQVTVWMAVGV